MNKIKDASVAKTISDSIADARAKYASECVPGAIVGASFNNFPYEIVIDRVTETGVQAQIDAIATTLSGEGYVDYLHADSEYGLSTRTVLVEVVSE